MAKRLLVLLLFVCTLTSCKAGNSVIVRSTITPISTETPTATSRQTLFPTITSTPTVSPDVMSYQCLNILDHPPSNYTLKGTLVYNNDDNTDAFLWDNDTKNVYRFPREEGDRLLDFDVSPDAEHILYQHYSARTKEQRLVIATAKGRPIWSQVIDSFYWNWFDDEHLVGLVIPENDTPSLFLLNPFTGEKQELRVDFPDSRLFISNNVRWRYSNGGLPIYDPTLTRVIYPECDPQCLNRQAGWPIVLWGVETDQVLARIMTMDVYGNTPLWLPDGKQFIIATRVGSYNQDLTSNEFYIMSRDGLLRQLTHFMDYYEQISIPDNYILSPDGKLLAFWIVAKPSRYEGARLAVLNIETGEVTNYCIQGDPLLDMAILSNNLVDPIWSPDSTQLLVISRDLQDQIPWRTVLLDLARGYATSVGDDTRPVAWMVDQEQ